MPHCTTTTKAPLQNEPTGVILVRIRLLEVILEREINGVFDFAAIESSSLNVIIEAAVDCEIEVLHQLERLMWTEMPLG